MGEVFPTEVFNHDVIHIYDYLRRFHIELSKSQSSPVSGMINADQARLERYLTSIRAMVTFIQGTPELDMPETHPLPYLLEAFPMEVSVENESINYLLRLIRAAAVELTNSQSARYASRFQPFDQARFGLIVDKIEAYLNDVIRANAVPLDLPESSPENSMPTDGFTGVHPTAK